MRHHRDRPLHVLVLAPVAAILAGALGPAPHALAAAPKAPVPIVVTVDPGFGGQPTAAHPTRPFDPGAIGTNGLLEKDVDLDVGARLATLLRIDLVDVVMTRSADVYVSVARRRQLSISHHAALVVSVDAGSSTSATSTGSLITYPVAASEVFAQILSDALGAETTPDGVPDRGVALDAKSWPGSRVPAATVEMASLSNPSEAALMATPMFRQDVATGLRNGIEAYMPSIIARRDAIIAWRHAHSGSVSPALAPTSASIPEGTGFQFMPLILWLLLIALTGAVLLWREQVARVLVVLIALVLRGFGSVLWLRRAWIRRRRRRQRAHNAPAPEPVSAQPFRRAGSVYDDIPL